MIWELKKGAGSLWPRSGSGGGGRATVGRRSGEHLPLK